MTQEQESLEARDVEPVELSWKLERIYSFSDLLRGKRDSSATIIFYIMWAQFVFFSVFSLWYYGYVGGYWPYGWYMFFWMQLVFLLLVQGYLLYLVLVYCWLLMKHRKQKQAFVRFEQDKLVMSQPLFLQSSGSFTIPPRLKTPSGDIAIPYYRIFGIYTSKLFPEQLARRKRGPGVILLLGSHSIAVKRWCLQIPYTLSREVLESLEIVLGQERFIEIYENKKYRSWIPEHLRFSRSVLRLLTKTVGF
jgi:hypothetical protein